MKSGEWVELLKINNIDPALIFSHTNRFILLRAEGHSFSIVRTDLDEWSLTCVAQGSGMGHVANYSNLSDAVQAGALFLRAQINAQINRILQTKAMLNVA